MKDSDEDDYDGYSAQKKSLPDRNLLMMMTELMVMVMLMMMTMVMALKCCGLIQMMVDSLLSLIESEDGRWNSEKMH